MPPWQRSSRCRGLRTDARDGTGRVCRPDLRELGDNDRPHGRYLHFGHAPEKVVVAEMLLQILRLIPWIARQCQIAHKTSPLRVVLSLFQGTYDVSKTILGKITSDCNRPDRIAFHKQKKTAGTLLRRPLANPKLLFNRCSDRNRPNCPYHEHQPSHEHDLSQLSFADLDFTERARGNDKAG